MLQRLFTEGRIDRHCDPSVRVVGVSNIDGYWGTTGLSSRLHSNFDHGCLLGREAHRLGSGSNCRGDSPLINHNDPIPDDIRPLALWELLAGTRHRLAE